MARRTPPVTDARSLGGGSVIGPFPCWQAFIREPVVGVPALAKVIQRRERDKGALAIEGALVLLGGALLSR